MKHRSDHALCSASSFLLDISCQIFIPATTACNIRDTCTIRNLKKEKYHWCFNTHLTLISRKIVVKRTAWHSKMAFMLSCEVTWDWEKIKQNIVIYTCLNNEWSFWCLHVKCAKKGINFTKWVAPRGWTFHVEIISFMATASFGSVGEIFIRVSVGLVLGLALIVRGVGTGNVQLRLRGRRISRGRQRRRFVMIRSSLQVLSI